MERKVNRKLALFRVFGGLLLGLAVVVGLLYLLVAANLSRNLVKSETYNIAISDTGAYDRIYEEVLADPDVEAEIGNLLGGVEFDQVDEVIGILREVMPPSYIQAQTEDNINRFTGFLRGEREELEIYARLRLPLQRVESAVLGEVHQRVEEMEIREPASTGCSVSHLRQLAAASAVPLSQLSAGQIPQSAPSLEMLSQECREREYDRWFGLLLEDAAIDRQTKDILERENTNLRRNFVGGDTRAFLKAVAGPLAKPLIDEAVGDIRRNLHRSEQFDILQWLADESEDISRRDIDEQAESLRDVASAVNGTGRVIALVVVIAGLLLMALIHLPRPARMLGWTGITLAVGGGVSLLAGFALNSMLPGRIGNAVLDRALYFDDAPVSAINLAADLATSLAGQATTGFMPMTVAVIAVGGALIVVSPFSGALTGPVRRILPGWRGKEGNDDQGPATAPLSEPELTGSGDSQDACLSGESSDLDSDKD